MRALARQEATPYSRRPLEVSRGLWISVMAIQRVGTLGRTRGHASALIELAAPTASSEAATLNEHLPQNGPRVRGVMRAVARPATPLPRLQA